MPADQINKAIRKAIRDEFPGQNNAGLRAQLRLAASKGAAAVEAVLRRTALTAIGEASGDAVVRIVREHAGN